MSVPLNSVRLNSVRFLVLSSRASPKLCETALRRVAAGLCGRKTSEPVYVLVVGRRCDGVSDGSAIGAGGSDEASRGGRGKDIGAIDTATAAGSDRVSGTVDATDASEHCEQIALCLLQLRRKCV